jgi:hypothetical protein
VGVELVIGFGAWWGHQRDAAAPRRQRVYGPRCLDGLHDRGPGPAALDGGDLDGGGSDGDLGAGGAGGVDALAQLLLAWHGRVP